MSANKDKLNCLLSEIKERILVLIGQLPWESKSLLPGKMLRSRFAIRLGISSDVASADLILGCVAIELVHAASLCHDDVIDKASKRRGAKAIWKQVSPRASILCGDLLLCEAMTELLKIDDRDTVNSFAKYISIMCKGEVRQECGNKGKEINFQEIESIARDKTGSLFAWAGELSGGANLELRTASANAGYAIGTAYQLADDLLDITPPNEISEKTLGTDAKRGVATGASDVEFSRKRIYELCDTAVDEMSRFPASQKALRGYLKYDFMPIIESYI